jgi:hypothetical protein
MRSNWHVEVLAKGEALSVPGQASIEIIRGDRGGYE